MISVYGWCALSGADLAALFAAGRERDIVEARGDFTVVRHARDGDSVITCRSGVVNYFYARGPAGIRHGRQVAAVATAAGLPWAWDYAAVADYLRLGHPLGEATAHAGVRRFPAGTVTRLTGCEATVTSWPEPGPGQGLDATGELLAAVAALDPACAVSLSGGLDSRVLLAALLHLGRRPALVVSGVPGSFDRTVATAIADRFRLPVTVIDVTAPEVVAGAPEIARATGGLLPLTNWAGLEHLRARHAQAGPVAHGANGEFARSYYAPGSGLAALRAAREPRSRFPALLAARVPKPFSEAETALLCRPLRAALRPASFDARLAATAANLPGRTAMDVTDEFFLREHGRQKTSADLAAISQYVDWRTPFFAPGWTAAVRELPRRWKLGDALHRRMIAGLFPALLAFPEEAYRRSATGRRAPARYWFGGPRPCLAPHYVDQRIFRDRALLTLFWRYRDTLADLIAPGLLDALAMEQVTAGTRPHQAFGLLALAMLRAPATGTGCQAEATTPYLSSS